MSDIQEEQKRLYKRAEENDLKKRIKEFKLTIRIQSQQIEELINRIDKAIEYIEWHYKDNQEFYKNKGIGLNYPECDGLLNILKGDNK